MPPASPAPGSTMGQSVETLDRLAVSKEEDVGSEANASMPSSSASWQQRQVRVMALGK